MSDKNTLYFGDNLDIMRSYIRDESIDLIYLDPPFNSKATYNVLFQEKNGAESAAQITAFADTWRWDHAATQAYHDTVKHGPAKLAELLQALRSFLGTNDMMAYLTMMAERLVEMRRILKPSGSIYLHCDPTASHYLKMLMDAIFGVCQFRAEIVWSYRRWPTKTLNYQHMHDIILYYSKQRAPIFNVLYEEPSESFLRRFKGKSNRLDPGATTKRATEDDTPGLPLRDVWDISMIAGSSKERLGYPTQKPEALLERLIRVSSNEGDLVLDPFCGCGTTLAVAERLSRRWIGIDITHLAIGLMRHRLEDTFGPELSPFEVVGDPKDWKSAEALAQQDRYQFEWWALGLVGARPAQDKKKGADAGIDGVLRFFDDDSGQAKTVIIQVKSGNVTSSQIRDLKGAVEREQAAIGAFITLREPTGPMKQEAHAAGFYEPEHFPDKACPKIQILTIEELLAGKELNYPRLAPNATFKRAERRSKKPPHEDTLLD